MQILALYNFRVNAYVFPVQWLLRMIIALRVTKKESPPKQVIKIIQEQFLYPIK